MDALTALKVILLGIVEGVTEFLPISSTGHLIIAADWLNFPGDSALDSATAKAFLVFIQLGAILAVLWLFRRTFWELASQFHRPGRSRQLLINLVIGTLPAVVIGLPTEEWIEVRMMKPIPVACALVAGGLAILAVERLVRSQRVDDVYRIRWTEALGVGCFQVLAILFPGMSRSASTILGGLAIGMTRKTATEFSFFLAVPAMCGASLVKLYGTRETLTGDVVPVFALGFVVSFIAALFVIRWLLRYVARNSFAAFGWYRIVFGALLLLFYANSAGFPDEETAPESPGAVESAESPAPDEKADQKIGTAFRASRYGWTV